MDTFEELSRWLQGYLAQQTSVVQSDRANNLLLAEVMNLVYHLVSFGYYVAPEDIRDLIKPLLSVADGRNDLLDPIVPGAHRSREDDLDLEEWRKTDRYKQSGDNTIVARVKSRTIRVLDLLLNLCDSIRLQHFMTDFKFYRTGGRQNSAADGSATAVAFLPLFKKLMAAETDEQLFELTTDVREYVREVFEASNWLTPQWHPAETPHTELVDVLLDLGRYEYSSLLTRTMDLCNRLFLSRYEIFELAVQAQVLLAEESIRLQEALDRDLPILRRISRGFVEPQEMEQFLSIVQEATQACYLNPNDDSSPPHTVNQNILCNSGITHILFDVLTKNADGDGQALPVVQATFRLLRGLARQNAPVQQAMFERFDSLVGCDLRSSGWQDTMAYAMTEVFTNNHRLCLSVRQRHVEAIVKVLQRHVVAVPSVLKLLEAIVKVCMSFGTGRVCVCVCVRACVRVCACVRVRVCVCACVRARVKGARTVQ